MWLDATKNCLMLDFFEMHIVANSRVIDFKQTIPRATVKEKTANVNKAPKLPASAMFDLQNKATITITMRDTWMTVTWHRLQFAPSSDSRGNEAEGHASTDGNWPSQRYV